MEPSLQLLRRTFAPLRSEPRLAKIGRLLCSVHQRACLENRRLRTLHCAYPLPADNISWTKPLRGRSWCGSRVGLSDHPRCCFPAPFSTPLCESMEQLLTAANSISQRSIHDFSTTPHDRGHANPQLSSEYPKVLR